MPPVSLLAKFRVFKPNIDRVGEKQHEVGDDLVLLELGLGESR